MLSPRASLIVRSVMSVIFLAFTWAGLVGGAGDLGRASNGGQVAQALCQFGYGLSAALCVLVAWRPHRLAQVIHRAWFATCALSAGLAAVYWGLASVWMGLASAAAGLLLAWLMIWPLRSSAPRAA